MNRYKILTSLIISILICNSIESYCIKAPFNKGVNLTNWFQVDSPKQIQFTKYTRRDFEQIKSLGCDAIRLPINLHNMTDGAPNYTIDPLLFKLLDEVVTWCEELEIHLILDNHTFDVTIATDPNVGTILELVWAQMATHYLTKSTKIYYEILNEPHGIEDSIWNAIQQKTVATIRTIDTKHTIIVGAANWNSYLNLDSMPVYEDSNLIYTFHFYDPFLFTHQGTDWTILAPASNIPFPYAEEEMPPIPEGILGTWGEDIYYDYKNAGNEEQIREWISIAANFSESRNVPVWCGEFGVFDRNCNDEDRVYWYGVVRRLFEEKQISWTIWDYQGAFGLYDKGSHELFEHDLNIPLLMELGLNIPEQTPFSVIPDDRGFIIYDDFFGERIREGSYGSGMYDFYSEVALQRGDYCFSWHGGNRYDALVLYFNPNRDLSYLSGNGYALAMMIKGDNPDAQFDIRFLDSDTSDPNDHPWRMRRMINKSIVKWDNEWHKLYLPLSTFTEQGSWDNGDGAWFNPEGKFNWKEIERLEIAQEYGSMGNFTLWFDDISITNQDTLMNEEPLGIIDINNKTSFPEILVLKSNKQIQIGNATYDRVIQYKLVDYTGRLMSKGHNKKNYTIYTDQMPRGLYILYMQNMFGDIETRKLHIN